MKTIPDNPEMNMLRKQAKDLLAGLRDRDSRSNLASAQAELADQYGFESWTDLKTEVDRRAGNADVAAPAFAADLAQRFDLGQPSGPMRSLAPADETGRRWMLPTTRGRFEARTLDTWWPMTTAARNVALQRAAAKAGVLLPTPLLSSAGEVVETVGGHNWWVHELLPSGPPLSAPASAGVTAQVGQTLGRIHRLRLPAAEVSAWGARRLSDVPWADIAAIAWHRGTSWAALMTSRIPELDTLTHLGQSGAVPSAVLTHNALGPGVCRVRTDGMLIVSGWEHAGGQPPRWEVASALAAWAVGPRGEVNELGARALTDGYAATVEEKPNLDITCFRGSANGILNYLDGLARAVLDGGAVPGGDVDRSVIHLLKHLPTVTTYHRLLAAIGVTS